MTVARTASPSPAAAPAGPRPALRLLPAPVGDPPYDDLYAPPPRLRLVPVTAPPQPETCPPASPAPPPAPPATRRPDEVRLVAGALVQRLVEVRGGLRPVSQLQRETTPGLYADLERALRWRRAPAGARRPGRDVLSLHVQDVTDDVAEVCATVRRGERVAALALRLERREGRWLCTCLSGL